MVSVRINMVLMMDNTVSEDFEIALHIAAEYRCTAFPRFIIMDCDHYVLTIWTNKPVACCRVRMSLQFSWPLQTGILLFTFSMSVAEWKYFPKNKRLHHFFKLYLFIFLSCFCLHLPRYSMDGGWKIKENKLSLIVITLHWTALAKWMYNDPSFQ